MSQARAAISTILLVSQVPHLVFGAAHDVFNLAFGRVDLAFDFELLVPDGLAYRFFDGTFRLIDVALDPVFVHFILHLSIGSASSYAEALPATVPDRTLS